MSPEKSGKTERFLYKIYQKAVLRQSRETGRLTPRRKTGIDFCL